MATDAFQWLNIRGPFPVDKGGNIYFPIPRDLVPDMVDVNLHCRLRNPECVCNLAV